MSNELVVFSALTVLSLAAACSDLRRRRIPNWLNAVIFLAGIVTVLMPGLSIFGFAAHLIHSVLALVAGILFFKFGFWGGGDAKFYSAAAVWFPISQAPILLLSTALSGAMLVAIYWLINLARHSSERMSSLPYGVAIAAGIVITAMLPMTV